MAVAGVIAEYNPFHRGHQHQLAAVRERLGGDTAIVAAMSGNVVQRGDFALIDKFARAEAALRGGADLVLELPSPWASATAERFAWGGVSLLAATGVVTHLSFGCECGEAEPLLAAARILDRPDFDERVKSLLGGGTAYAQARQRAAETLAGRELTVLQRPNNNLAVEYLRALDKLDSGIETLAIPRVGAEHDSGEVGEFSSASAIRERILVGEPWEELVPETTADILRREVEAGRGPLSLKSLERAVLARLRTMDEEDFLPYDGGGEGLYHRFYAAVREAVSLEDILAGTKTRRYTLARIRRMLLHSFLALVPAGREDRIPYIRILGANDRGRRLLREMGERASLPLLTKPGDAGRLGPQAEKLMAEEARVTDLYTLAWPELAEARPGREYRRGPVML